MARRERRYDRAPARPEFQGHGPWTRREIERTSSTKGNDRVESLVEGRGEARPMSGVIVRVPSEVDLAQQPAWPLSHGSVSVVGSKSPAPVGGGSGTAGVPKSDPRMATASATYSSSCTHMTTTR